MNREIQIQASHASPSGYPGAVRDVGALAIGAELTDLRTDAALAVVVAGLEAAVATIAGESAATEAVDAAASTPVADKSASTAAKSANIYKTTSASAKSGKPAGSKSPKIRVKERLR